MTDNALTPIEQTEVEFYGDDITAVVIDDGTVFIPLRPLCGFLGIDWASQYQRLRRDDVLSSEYRSVVVMTTDRGARATICLPLDFLPGWLFTIDTKRVKAELRTRLIRYQRECYKVLSEAFRAGRLTSSIDFDELLQAKTPAVQAYKTIMALAEMARNQVLLEAKVIDHDRRLETIEAQLGNPERLITNSQAERISQAVKAVALELGRRSGKNEHGGVYGEVYRTFSITSYKELPASRYGECIQMLTDWHESLTDNVIF